MTQRCIEVIRRYFNFVPIEARTTVDLEHVQLFSEVHRDGTLDEGKTHVQLTGGTEWILDIPYDEFKTLHNAYQNSKNPQQISPDVKLPPPSPVDCIHPPNQVKIAFQGFPYCGVCGKPLPGGGIF